MQIENENSNDMSVVRETNTHRGIAIEIMSEMWDVRVRERDRDGEIRREMER